MIRVNPSSRKPICTRLLWGLLAVSLIATLAAPALAQTSGTWSTTGSLNTARSGHTATLLANGQVLVAGGSNATGALASAELYNPATGKWTATASMATRRYAHSATLLSNGAVLVAGGIVNISNTGIVTVSSSAELYNPFTGQWTTTGSMTSPRYSQGATLLQNGQVLTAGGVNATDGSLASAELYDPSQGSWKATGSMNYPRSTPATLLQNGQVLMAAGSSTSPGEKTAELYSNGHWTLTSGLVFSHAGVSAALLTSGDVLIFGGHLASYASEFYNPTTNTWSRTGNIGVNPPGGPLTLLGTGEVMLAGGQSSYGTDSLCRLYNPSTNSWLLTGSMNQARAGHTATRLANGRVLAVGGLVKSSNGAISFLASAELYTP